MEQKELQEPNDNKSPCGEPSLFFNNSRFDSQDLDCFDPSSSCQNRTFRQNVIRSLGLGVGSSVLLIIIPRMVLSYLNPTVYLINGLFALILIVAGLIVKRIKNPDYLGYLIVLCIGGVGLNSGLANGGILAPAALTLCLAPFFGFFCAGRKGGGVALLISFFGILFLIWAEQNQWVEPLHDLKKYSQIKALIYAGGALCLFVGGWAFERAREASEANLRRSEGELRGLFNVTPACIKVINCEGRLLAMNDRGLEILEADSIKEVEGKSILDLISQQDQGRFSRMHDRICAGGPIETLEFQITTLKGHQRYIESSSIPLKQKDGKFVQLAVSQDVTEKYLIKLKLNQSLNILNSVMENSPFGVLFVQHSSERLLHANQLFYQMFHISSHELNGKDESEIYNYIKEHILSLLDKKSYFQDHWNPINDNRQSGRWSAEFRTLENRYLNIQSMPIQIDNKNNFGRLYLFEDITELKIENHQKENQMAILTLAAQNGSIHDIFSMIISELEDLGPNYKCCLFLKKEDQNNLILEIGGSLSEAAKEALAIVPIQEMAAPCGMAAVLQERLYFENIHGNSEWKNKKVIESLGDLNFCWSEPIAFGEEIIGVLDIYSPFPIEPSRALNAAVERATQLVLISVKKVKIEQELDIQRKQAILTAKMAALGEMAGGVAHEINNPLAIINGRIGILKDLLNRPLDKIEVNKIAEGLEKISATTLRIASIIKGLKVFARDAGGDPFVSTSIKQIVDTTIEICKEKYQQRGIQLDVLLDKDVLIDCRETQIVQILVNLLGNALDAIEHLDERWVKLEVAVLDRIVEIRVIDCGRGIPSDVVDRIMQPFFTTKPVGKGTGLGLSISRGIAEEHHGTLYYDSKSIHTTFVLSLPILQHSVVGINSSNQGQTSSGTLNNQNRAARSSSSLISNI